MTTAETKAPEGSRPFVDYETVDGDGHTVLGSYDWWKPYLPKKYWEWAPQPIREPNQEGNVLCEGRVYKLPNALPRLEGQEQPRRADDAGRLEARRPERRSASRRAARPAAPTPTTA